MLYYTDKEHFHHHRNFYLRPWSEQIGLMGGEEFSRENKQNDPKPVDAGEEMAFKNYLLKNI